MPAKEKWRIKKRKPERVFRYKGPSKSKKREVPKHIIRYGRKYTLIGKYPTLAQAESVVRKKNMEPFCQVIFERGVTRYIAYGTKVKERR